MRYFAGLDVSPEETTICVVDETGCIMKELRAASEPDSLITALQHTGLPLERIGLEACSLSSLIPSCGGPAPTAKRSERPTGTKG